MLVSAEQERHPQNPILQEFIEGELERQKTLAETLPDDRKRDWSGLNGAFLKAVGWKKGGKG